MKEGTPYTIPKEPAGWRSFALAVLVHLALLALLWIGVRWQNETPTAVEAEIWSPQAQQAAPKPQPEPEAAQPPPPPPPPRVVEAPKPQPAPPVEKPVEKPVPNPDIALEQEKKRKLKEEKERREREEEEREERAEQKKLAQQKQEQAEARKKELAKAEADKERRLEAERERERERKLEQQAAQKREAEEERKRELAEAHKKELAKAEAEKKRAAQAKADAEAAEQRRIENLSRMTAQATGSGGSGQAAHSQGPSRADAGYAAKVGGKIRSNTVFNVPEELANNPAVEYAVDLLPDGSVRSIRKIKGSGVPGFDEAVKRAIEKSQPFPPDQSGRAPSGFTVSHKPKDQ
jgi:colicin import membrane protein